MNTTAKGYVTSFAIIGGTAIGIMLAMRYLLGTNFANIVTKVGEAVWGREGFTEALGSYLTPIFKPAMSGDEQDAKEKRDNFQNALNQGSTVEEAFASAGIVIGDASATSTDKSAKVAAVKNRLVQISKFNAEQLEREEQGLPRLSSSAIDKKFHFNIRDVQEAAEARLGRTLASFGTPGSVESREALSEELRKLNITDLNSILGQDTLQNAITVRQLATPVIHSE